MRTKRGRASRIEVALICLECGSRNYKTTKSKDSTGPLALSKFCKVCNGHTKHQEGK